MIEFNSLFRNSADPFVNGSMRSSNSEQYLSRVAEPEDFDLKNGLNDLSNVVSISLEKLLIYFCFKFINLKTSMMSNLRVGKNSLVGKNSFLHDVENLNLNLLFPLTSVSLVKKNTANQLSPSKFQHR